MIEVALFDIDGVLTDGMVYVDSEGKESKRISFDDIDAVFELKRAGVKVGFITGEDNGFIKYVKKRFVPDYFVSGCKDKLVYFKDLEEKEGLDKSRTCFVGDSRKDVKLLEYLEYSFVPSDIDNEIKESAKFITKAVRGKGVIKDVARFILKEGNAENVSVDIKNRYKELKGSSKGNQKTVAIIPARGGSKGIRHKNVKLLVGKPLIHYVIETCLQTPEVDTVVVSTDSNEIKKAVSKFNEVIIINRPVELADDDTTSEDVLLHAIEQIEKEGVEFNTILFVQATSPLSEPSDFSRLLKKINNGYDSAAFYVEDYGSFFGESYIFSVRLPRQHKKPRKREAGNAWAFCKQGFVKHKTRMFGQIGLCKIEYPKDLEIDSDDDLSAIERLLQIRERKKRHMYYQIRHNKNNEKDSKFDADYWGVIVDPDGKKRVRSQERALRIEDVKEECSYINQLPPGRILDIGCGMGDLLSGVNNDWEKHGVDVSELAAREAAKYGNIFVGCLKDAPYKDELFDLIVMHHAIEHFSNVEDEIVVVRDLLKHNGKLIVGTPDFDSAMARRYGEKYRLLHDKTHISLFSRISLRYFLEDFGFEIEKESFPFFETRHFTKENLLRLLNADQVSPPFWGSFMTFYCVKK